LRKRWDVFLAVAAAVLRRSPNSLFVIAGDGPERSRLESLAATLGVKDRVMWMGWTTEMDRFYSALDVLLFNSDWDALGRTPVEAAAHGVPVVASVAHGGLREVHRDGVDAFVLESHDIEELCGRILDLQDEQLAAKMVESARRHLAANYSPERDASTLCRLLGVS
jgi:glycosyltransferase involved in cell wall biosynthesis